MDNLNELYEQNNEFKEFVNNYSNQYDIPIETCFTHKIICVIGEYYKNKSYTEV